MDSNIINRGAQGPRIGSFNCNGLGNKGKRDLVLNWLKTKEEEIFLLQETHSTGELEGSWRTAWEGDIYFNHGTSNSTGTAILLKRNTKATISVSNHRVILQGRSSLVELEVDGVKYCIVNVYAPNNDSVEFMETVFSESLGRERDDFIILAGDWNTIMSNLLDKKGGVHAHQSSRTQNFLNMITSEYSLSDVLRVTKGDLRMFTHFNKQHKTATRLDFFLVDDRLINFPQCNTSITHGFKSDHSYISLHLMGSEIKHGRGYWKLNNSLLADEDFLKEAKDIIQDTSNDSYDSFRGVWDVIKFKIKDLAMKMGKKKKREKCQEKKRLEKEIEKLNANSDCPQNELLRNKLYDFQYALDVIISEETQGNIVRSRANWTEKGERSTKYFFSLEKNNGKKKALTKIIDNNGTISLDQQGISRSVVDFYQKLFNSRRPAQTEIDEYITSSNLNRVSDEMLPELEDTISLGEMDQVVGKLKNNKSPGWDGLSAEFYKAFWPDIRHLIHQVFLESIDAGSLSPSQRIGIITLLPKPKSPVELVYLKNWRPITLLNVDYKIFTHVIKNRLVKTLPTIISNVQSGFQAGKSTCDNLILMCLTLDFYQENSEEEGMLLQVDFEKAFDSVEHTFLYSTLRSMGFGDYILNLVKVAFSGCMSYANVNGHLSDPIYLMRGLHQGSPLSPILFLIVAQVFSFKIQRDPNIKGLSVGGVVNLLSLFADDTDIFLEPSARGVQLVVEELETFGRVSGCRPNIAKTHCVPLGKARFNAPLIEELKTLYGENFVVNDFTALGIHFSNNSPVNEIVLKNYETKIEKATAWINMWNKRYLTIFGKITIVKSLIYSQFSYLIIPLPRPDPQIFKRINTLVFNFVWGGKRDKIKRDVVKRPIDGGGLDLFLLEDFFISLKSSLLSKIFNDKFSHAWKNIFINQLRQPNHPALCIENSLVKRGCNFTQDLLTCYSKWREAAAEKLGGSVNHCVWGNSRITDVGARLWNMNLINQGIMYITDFLNDSFVILNYRDFLSKWGLNVDTISSIEYVNIKMALRRYDCPSIASKSISLVETKINLSFITNRTVVTGKHFREAITPAEDANTLAPLKVWTRALKRYSNSINWGAVLYNNNKGVTNNFRMVQFQYKFLMRISTCKLMRFKMKIALDNGLCRHCHRLESLTHIFFECDHTSRLLAKLGSFIRLNFDNTYSDNLRYYLVTCNHENQVINYLNMAVKWYISRQYQASRDLHWAQFLNYLRIQMIGERPTVRTALVPLVAPN